MCAEWQATFVCSRGSGGPTRGLFLTVRRRAGFRLFSERSRRRRPRFINLFIMKFVTAAPLPLPADRRYAQAHPRMFYGLFQEYDTERAENLYHTVNTSSRVLYAKRARLYVIRTTRSYSVLIEISTKISKSRTCAILTGVTS